MAQAESEHEALQTGTAAPTRGWQRGALEDLMSLGGLALLCYGIAAVYLPAALIVLGAALFAAGIRLVRVGPGHVRDTKARRQPMNGTD